MLFCCSALTSDVDTLTDIRETRNIHDYVTAIFVALKRITNYCWKLEVQTLSLLFNKRISPADEVLVFDLLWIKDEVMRAERYLTFQTRRRCREETARRKTLSCGGGDACLWLCLSAFLCLFSPIYSELNPKIVSVHEGAHSRQLPWRNDN